MYNVEKMFPIIIYLKIYDAFVCCISMILKIKIILKECNCLLFKKAYFDKKFLKGIADVAVQSNKIFVV